MHGQFYKTKKNLKLDIGCVEIPCVAFKNYYFEIKIKGYFDSCIFLFAWFNLH